VISVRPARPTDAAAIGAVHVAAWRSAYPGILPDAFLSRLSVPRQAAYYDSAIRGGVGVHVATASGPDLGMAERAGGGARVIGFVSDAPARTQVLGAADPAPLGDGEIETLYVLDDWRDRGLGRRLMRAAAAHLAAAGCGSAFVWVLRDNPSRWFYERLGGKPVAESTISVGGAPVVQMAYVWSPIDKLVQATSAAP
jgi:ribosomal protein S18 acetylase RimI-like enzyme